MDMKISVQVAAKLYEQLEIDLLQVYPDLKIVHRVNKDKRSGGAFNISADGTRCMILDSRILDNIKDKDPSGVIDTKDFMMYMSYR